MKKKIAVLLSPWFIDFVDAFLQGLQNACKGKDIDLYVFAAYKFNEVSGEANTTGFAIFDLINYEDYDGVIIIPQFFNDNAIAEREIDRIRKSGIPAVSVNQELGGFHFLYNETYNEVKQLVSHLIEIHRVKKFAFIGGPADNKTSNEILICFLEVLADNNIKIDKHDIYLGGDWSYNYAYTQAVKIFEQKDNIPEAVVCINDLAAMAAITSASEHGYNVPNDVLVVGYDNVDYSNKVIPSITTIDSRADKIGEAAIQLILENPKQPVRKKIDSRICYRQSCGCEKVINNSQIAFVQHFTKDIDYEQRFASQLRHMEDSFLHDENLKELTKTLQSYFTRRHDFEGPDFSVLISSKVVKGFKNTSSEQIKYTKIDSKVYSLVNILNGQAVKAGEIIKKEQLLPDSLKADGSNLYLFLPIFNKKSIHGYYVSKNNYNIIMKKSAYNWTRNFGTILEKFRTTTYYRYISEDYRKLSTTDAVSGLLNRSGMELFACELFQKNNEENKKTAIIFADINQMKIINDRFGHLHGDLAIHTVAEAIKQSIPKDYFAIRYGGDEFLIVGTARLINPLASAEMISKKIRDYLIQAESKMTLPYHLTISIGTKIIEPKAYSELSAAIKEADEAMYTQKTEFHRQFSY